MTIEQTNQGNPLTIDLAAAAMEDPVAKVVDDFGDEDEPVEFSEKAMQSIKAGVTNEYGEALQLPPDTPQEIVDAYLEALSKRQEHIRNNGGLIGEPLPDETPVVTTNIPEHIAETHRHEGIRGHVASVVHVDDAVIVPEKQEVTSDKVTEPFDDEEEKKPVTLEYTAAPVHYNINYTYPVYGQRKPNSPYITRLPKRLSRLAEGMKNWTAMERISNGEFDEETSYDIQRTVNGYEQLADAALVDSFHADRGWYENILDDEKRNWRQDLLNENGQDYSARQAKIDAATTPRTLTGSNAISRITSLIGSGLGTRVALIHSGFHVHLKPPSDADVLNLELELSMFKSQAGYDTSGIIFQNSQYGIVEKVFQFIMEHVADMNVVDFRNHDMAKHIRVSDLALLYWAMASAMYPQGYQIELPCSNDPGVCRHREVVHANIYRMRWYDESSLTESQLAMLRRAKTKFAIEDLEEYQTTKGSNQVKRVTIGTWSGENVDVLLQMPSVADYLDSGRRFVDAAKDALTRVMVQDKLTEEQKQVYVLTQMRLASLCEYAYWVKTIYIGKDIIEDVNTIHETLRALSAEQTAHDKLHAEVQLFIEETTKALIAIPNFSCPECGHDYSTDENSKYPELVPINPLKLFFDLRDHRSLRRKQSPTA